MKQIFAFLICALMLVSLAACGKTETDSKDETTADSITEAFDETTGLPEAEPEETAEADDDALIDEIKEKLLGSWICAGIDPEHLTFNEDGTGSYSGLDDKNYSFTYVVYVDHKAYNNGAAYIDNMLKIDYDTGESEEIIIHFNEGEKTELVFHNSESGGYNGVMNYFDVWTKE